MRVRIDKDLAAKVRSAMKKSGRKTAAREVNIILSEYFARKETQKVGEWR